MKTVYSFLSTLPLMLFAPAFAGEPEEWHRCKSDEECVIVDEGCGVERAANKEFMAEVRKNDPSYSCLKPIEFHPPNTVAKCVSSKCTLLPPGHYAGGKAIER